MSQAASRKCPKCGGSTRSPFNVDGVCLHCAGLRVLGGDVFEPPPHDESLDRIGIPLQIGPYSIIEEVGRGGMGRVYAATQPGLGRIVALKVLSAAGGDDAVITLRFLREAQIAASLRHPNIVPVHDSGTDAAGAYFTMDYIEGGDLARRLRTGEPLTPRNAAGIVHKLAGALAHTHAQGILHRDIKPSNILLDGDEPRLADFGLAAQLEPGGDLTAVTRVLGTPHYLAPEAMREGSAALSPASDIYALGVVLYEMLAGRTPFAGASLASLPQLVEGNQPPPLTMLVPDVPVDLSTICHKCIESEAARRYTSAGDLASDLGRFLADEPILARPPGHTERFVRFARRNRAAVGSTLAVALALMGTTAFSSWQAVRAERAERDARAANARSLESLREARLAEAGALQGTTKQGRRAQSLTALAVAAAVRQGPDIRDAAVASLQLFDVRAMDVWDLPGTDPVVITASPDGQTVLMAPVNSMGITGMASIHRWGENTPVAALALEEGLPVAGPFYSPDGSLLAVRCRDDSLRVLSARDGTLVRCFEGHPLPQPRRGDVMNRDFAFTSDSAAIAIAAPSGGYSVYRIADGVETARAEGGTGLTTLAYSPDGRWLAAIVLGDANAACQIEIYDARAHRLAHRVALASLQVYFAWSSDSSRLAVYTEDHLLSQFDPATGALMRRFPIPFQGDWQVKFVGGDRYIASSGSAMHLHFCNADDGTPQVVMEGRTPSLLDSPFCDAPLLLYDDAGHVSRLTLDLPVAHRVVLPPTLGSEALGTDAMPFAVSSDGSLLATGDGRFISINRLSDARLVGYATREDPDGIEYSSVAFSPDDSRLYWGTSTRGLWVFDLVRNPDGTIDLGKPRQLDGTPGFWLTGASRDRSRFAQVNPGTGDVRVLELGPGDACRELSRWNTPHAFEAGFTAEASQVLVNSDFFGADPDHRRLLLHDAQTGRGTRDLKAPVGALLRFSADGNSVMTVNGPDLSIVWDAHTWTRRAELRGELGGPTTTFCLSPDASQAAIVNGATLHIVRVADSHVTLKIPLTAATTLYMGMEWRPDGHLILRGWDGRIDVVDPERLQAHVQSLGLSE